MLVKTEKKKLRRMSCEERMAFAARCVQEIRIAIMVTDYAEYHETLITGYKEEMDHLIPSHINVSYEIFSSQGSHKELAIDNFKAIYKRKFDLIYAIGFLQVVTVKEMRKVLSDKTPVMFAGVHHPVKKKILRTYQVSHNGIFGVSAESPCNIIPAQLILISHPEIETFFLPYRFDSVHNFVSAEIDSMCRYFQEYGREIIKRPYDDSDIADVLNEMEQHKAVILPEGGMSFMERDMFLERSRILKDKGHEIAIFADGKEAVAKGAVFGIRSDVWHVGRINAKQTADLFIHKVPSHKIKSVELTCPRSLVVNMSSRTKSRYGAVFMRDIVALAQDSFLLNEPIPGFRFLLKVFASFSEANTPFLREALAAITQKVKTRLAEVTEKALPLEIIEGDEATPMVRDMHECIADILQMKHNKKIYIAGGRAIEEAAQQIAQLGRKMDMESVQIAAKPEEAQGFAIKLGNGSLHRGRIFRPIDPHAILSTMKNCVKRCDKAFIIIGLDKEKLPAGIEDYIEEIREKAAELRIEPRFYYGTDIDEIVKYLRKHSKTMRNVFFSFPHLIDNDVLDAIVMACREEGILFGVPSLRYKGRLPVTFGVHDNESEFVVEKRITLGDGGAIDVIADASSYSFHVAKDLVELWGGEVCEKKLRSITYHVEIDSTVAS